MSPLWVLLLLPTLTYAGVTEDATRLFSSLDTNGDGKLEPEEFFVYMRAFDIDHDGGMSLAEHQNLINSVVPALVKYVAPRFNEVDLNKDGKHDEAEMYQTLLFMDTDKSGIVERPEFVKFIEYISSYKI
ncbi:uncharacterized protein LOC131951065 [Physella acuta]|uniref:uncharacterized protein LOC131951065 n=1 Tax=Physella acuta TaxID=109671 RepID=UPI0027DD039B|nr:uncharacterized protein LOC131951065 [Physella acuta]XP_059169315.1 uncharacterized protein LOC131951065 [Physella acuta]